MDTLEVGKRYRSVDNRRVRTVKLTAIHGDGTMVSLTNEATGRTTKVKASRLSSHGGYKPLDAPPAPPAPPALVVPEPDSHDQHLLDQASGEGMIPRDEHGPVS